MKPPRDIRLHIERLVLDGLPVKASDGSIVHAAIEGELARLLAEQGLSDVSAGAVQYVSGSPIELANDAKPAPIGHQIARTLFSTLNSQHVT